MAASLERPVPTAGELIRSLRDRRRVSQLELSLRAGVSQRHLSCVETGRAGASREMLLALLGALDAPLGERDEVLLAAGFAPVYGRRALDHADLAPVREALRHLLLAHEPSPAVVLNSAWELLDANRGATTLLELLGADPRDLGPGTNMLKATLLAGPLRRAIVNGDEVRRALWQRASREAEHVPELRAVLLELKAQAPRGPAVATSHSPLLVTRLHSRIGELTFFSTFTTFGTPLDVTIASLRVEHMFPADDATRRAMERASRTR